MPNDLELTPDLLPAARAMALLWTFRTRAAILALARNLGYEGDKGDPLKLQQVSAAVARLTAAGLAFEHPEREGLVRLAGPVRATLYADLLAENLAADLQRALHDLEGLRPDDLAATWPAADAAATVALFRLAVFAGTPAGRLKEIEDLVAAGTDGDAILDEAVFADFDPQLAGRIDPAWRSQLVSVAATRLCLAWQTSGLAVADWALALPAGDWPPAQRLDLAEVALHRGDAARVRALLGAADDGHADALRAGLLVQAGQYGEAAAAFEAALKRRQGEASARRRLLPASLAWYYPFALLAHGSPQRLEPALRFCIGEAGERDPDPDRGWGIWAHAIAVRLGETAPAPDALRPRPAADLDGLWRLLAAAWLGGETAHGGWNEAAAALAAALKACRFAWLAGQVGAAQAALQGEAAADSPFAGRGESWRPLLASLQALAESGAADEEATRLLWNLRLGDQGRLEDIEVLEQKHGARGWGSPRPASLARLAEAADLSPEDARVARAIRPDGERRFRLDLATAVLALVGHPNVSLAEAPEQPVELVEAAPEIVTARAGDGFVVRLQPPLRAEADDADPLAAISVIRESASRLRLVRFSPAQRRAARLIGDGLALPAAAQGELRQALQALAGHFQVEGEQAQGARQVAADPRLRAELSLLGEQLRLRLVVAPLGPDGPRPAPGRGRARLMASVGGETLATRRDLAAERANLDAVFDAFDFLDEPDPGEAACEWNIDDPLAGLELLDRLPRLPAVAALEWPKGEAIRVAAVDRGDLRVRVRGERDGFHLEGEAEPLPGVVIRLPDLLAAARGDSRFVPLGEGLHLALTRELKRRLADLEALAEEEKDGGVRLPRIAGAWLAEALEGMAVAVDAAAQDDFDHLRRLEDESPETPRALLAALRPYQEEGFRWAMRLAAAGFGGCLADDMGLGKTLQAIAVLLARAGGGPALVLAPTSVTGNWRAELERFAPGLGVSNFGDDGREAPLAAGPGEVVIASYGLFMLNEEAFAATAWHTVVADEAQAIKNAQARRSQAAFGLGADFRLALTGTPVENRLAELWSIMHFANPGLLGSLERFTRRFASPIEKKRDRQAQRALRRLVGPFILRRTKAQVLQELPPRTETLLEVVPDDTEAAHYEALRQQALDEAGRALAIDPERARINILAQLTRLRRAACDPRLVTPEFAVEGAKVLTFGELAADLSANGHKALVFSQFVDFLHLLQAPLDAAGIAYQYLDGSVPAAERSRRIAAFQAGEGDFFLISLKAGGFGLNLTAADYVVITDPWWNPAAEDQAMGRAHRMGQQRPVTVYRMVTRGSVEERIVRLHRDKRALAESVLAEGAAAALPSSEDLLALIRETMG